MNLSALSLIFTLLGGLIAFFTAAALVHFSIILLNIQKQRVRTLLRWIPFAAVLSDLLLLNFSLSNWLNPLSCISCTQKLLLSLFFPYLQSHLSEQQISLIHYLEMEFFSPYSPCLAGGLLAVSLFLVGRKLLLIFLAKRSLHAILATSIPSERPLTNPLLKRLLDERRTKLLLSDKIAIPMATFQNAIVMPKESALLSQCEFEAVIAHEAEHLRWKDPQVRLLISLFSSFFWWIPIAGWIKIVEEEQEMGCDQGVINHKLSSEALASALLKFSLLRQKKSSLGNCHLTEQESPTKKRIKLLHSKKIEERLSITLIIILTTLIAIIFLCKTL